MKVAIEDGSRLEVSANGKVTLTLPQGKSFKSAAICAFFIFLVINLAPSFFIERKNHASDTSISDNHKLKNFVQNCNYESEQCGTWPWWVARAYFQAKNPQIVTMGDSQLNAALIQADSIQSKKAKDCVSDRDCIALKTSLRHLVNYDFRLVNLALGGAMPSDYYLMSSAFFSSTEHPKIVVLSVGPRSFLDATLSSASTTETFQFLAPYVNLKELADYAFNKSWENALWQAKDELCLYKYRQEIALSVHQFLARLENFMPKQAEAEGSSKDKLGQSIYGGSGLVQKGTNVVVPNPNVPFRGNLPEYQRRFALLKASTLTAQSKFFAATLKHLNDLKIKVIVVDMPMLPQVRGLLSADFWQHYHAQMRLLCAKNGADWYDLSNDKKFCQADFLDYVHLNARGGQKFVDCLAEYIARAAR